MSIPKLPSGLVNPSTVNTTTIPAEDFKKNYAHLGPVVFHTLSFSTAGTPPPPLASEMGSILTVIAKLQGELGSAKHPNLIFDPNSTFAPDSPLGELLDVSRKINTAMKASLPTTVLEQELQELFTLTDESFDKIEFESLDLYPLSPPGIKYISWIETSATHPVNEVVAPFFTCIVQNKIHVAMYDCQDSLENRVLKVVAGPFLCELLLNLPAGRPLKVVVALLPLENPANAHMDYRVDNQAITSENLSPTLNLPQEANQPQPNVTTSEAIGTPGEQLQNPRATPRVSGVKVAVLSNHI